MELTLDLSPMLVNRTAVFHICKVALEALSEHAPERQYFGEAIATPPVGADAERLKDRLAQALASPEAFASGAAKPAPASARRRIFLDPLYVLFSGLDENDVVVINDLSPVTTPAWHSAAVGELYGHAFARIAACAPRLLAISHNTAQTFYANYGYTRRPIEVTHLFVPEHVVAAETRLHTPRPYFLFVGSLEARKNVVGAIAAFQLSGLAQSGYDLLIVGGSGHGERQALDLGRSVPGVVFCGFVEDAQIAGVYAGATGFLYPSYLEGFGVPLLEALFHGLPAVASTTGACREVGGKLVRYCDPDDHAALASELRRMAGLSPAERRTFAEAARARVTEHFSLQSYVSRFRRLVTGP